MITEETTLAAFYQALPQDQFLAVESDEHGRLYYPVEEGLAGIDWSDPDLARPIKVVWNDEKSVALVAECRPDPRCRVLVTRKEVFDK